jgi:hypothetical protein
LAPHLLLGVSWLETCSRWSELRDLEQSNLVKASRAHARLWLPAASERAHSDIDLSVSDARYSAAVSCGQTTTHIPTEPLIKRHATTIDMSSEFSEPKQNPSIRDQWLTAETPTARARQDHGWLV